jgi:hypothetical protein
MNNREVLIASWRARLEFLMQQLDVLKSDKVAHEKVGIAGIGQLNVDLIPDDIRRVESWISELRALLAEHSK